MTGKHGPPEERFWFHIDKNGPIPECRPDLGPCWLWQGAKYSNGYGQFRAAPGHRMSAHTFAYELEYGPLPLGLEPDHLCRNRECCRASHLEAVTHAENMRRARRTHCRRGHPYDETNTYVGPERGRGIERCCRECRRLRLVAFQARRRQSALTKDK